MSEVCTAPLCKSTQAADAELVRHLDLTYSPIEAHWTSCLALRHTHIYKSAYLYQAAQYDNTNVGSLRWDLIFRKCGTLPHLCPLSSRPDIPAQPAGERRELQEEIRAAFARACPAGIKGACLSCLLLDANVVELGEKAPLVFVSGRKGRARGRGLRRGKHSVMLSPLRVCACCLPIIKTWVSGWGIRDTPQSSWRRSSSSPDNDRKRALAWCCEQPNGVVLSSSTTETPWGCALQSVSHSHSVGQPLHSPTRTLSLPKEVLGEPQTDRHPQFCFPYRSCLPASQALLSFALSPLRGHVGRLTNTQLQTTTSRSSSSSSSSADILTSQTIETQSISPPRERYHHHHSTRFPGSRFQETSDLLILKY